MRSKTPLYQAVYTVTEPLLRLLYAWLPKYVTTSEQVGRAMIKIAKEGAAKSVLESSDIDKV